jgi:DNA-binding XRE family transcriptional regulator
MSKRSYKSNCKTEEDTVLNKAIGKRIKEARINRIVFINVPEIKNVSSAHTVKKQKTCTQTELSKAIGVTFQQIQKYEKGYNGLSTIKLLKISKFFGKPIEYFTDEANELLGQDNLPDNNPEKTLAPTMVTGLN